MQRVSAVVFRQLPIESHSLRTKIISMLFEKSSITKKSDIIRNLKPNQMKKNSQNMAKIVSLIDTTMNPFSENIPKEQLYNIGSGKVASQQTTNFLLIC